MPGDVGVLGLLVLVAGACCLLGATFPISEQAPVELARVLAVVGFAVGIALLAGGARVPRWGLHGAVVFVTVAASVLISQSTTNGGQMLTAWVYAWMAVYVGLFFARRAIYAHVALMTAGCIAGIAVAGLSGTLVQAAIVTVTLWTAGIALGMLSERLRSQADTDPMTGLLNRNGFLKAAARELALASRTHNPLTVAIADLDGFKRVNDEHGHAAGDLLLIELAAAWGSALRPGDILARFGGDEFVLLFPATIGREAHTALARLQTAHPASWSVGAAEWARGESLADCLARADERLYVAKAARLTPASAP